jgi:hypothetical protein
MTPTSPVVEGLEPFEFKFGASQPEYQPLPALVGNRPDVNVISRWEPTAEERQMIADGADIYVVQTTFGDLFHPINVAVGGRKQDAAEFMRTFDVGTILPKENVDEALDKLSRES